MDIGEVSKRAGISASALRYYEQLGLISSVDRKGLRRQYSANVLETLALIALGKLADFQLEELPRLIKQKTGRATIDRLELRRKSLEIEKKIRKMEAARLGLIHASECRAPSHLECPKFQRLLTIATMKQIKKRKTKEKKR